MTDSTTCPKCSGPRDIKALYCPFCGAVFEETDRRSPGVIPTPQPVPAPPRSAPPEAGSASSERQENEAPGPRPEALPEMMPEAGAHPEQGQSAPFVMRRHKPMETLILANRWQRLMAHIIDITLFIGPLFLSIALLSDTFQWSDLGLMRGLVPGLLILLSCAWMLMILILNLIHLSRSGQSLGKKSMQIRIVGYTNERVGLIHIVFLRMLPISLLSLIPFFGRFLGLLDVLLIFGDEKRCLHDYIAGTKVVEVPPATARD